MYSTASQSSASTIARPSSLASGGRPSIANTTNIDTLLNAKEPEKHKIPNDKIQVSFFA